MGGGFPLPHPLHLLAYDYGASSGRAMLGDFDGNRLALSELHRFANEPVQLSDALYWDVLDLYAQLKLGLQAARKAGIRPDAIGIDTWGVDFGLLDRDGRLLGNPVHYRDARTEGMMDKAFARMPRETLFDHTGLAFMPFNTLYQLLALEGHPLRTLTERLLFMPDLLAYFLTGVQGTEYTIASTGQLIDPRARDWSKPVLSAFGLPESWFAPLCQPGTVRGTLLARVLEETGLSGEIPVVAVASHDTASAVAAVPAASGRFAYVSSGTWSLLGVETPAPVIKPAVLSANYTNEGGAFGTTRVLKNIMGLWMIQECRRIWQREGFSFDYAGLAAMAEGAEPFLAFVDPDDALFLHPGDMPSRIRSRCLETGQSVPETPAQIARLIYECLALKYRWAVERLERDILGEGLDALYIVGGGSQNRLLNQMTANALKKPVVAGPGEATAIGNLLMQAVALVPLWPPRLRRNVSSPVRRRPGTTRTGASCRRRGCPREAPCRGGSAHAQSPGAGLCGRRGA